MVSTKKIRIGVVGYSRIQFNHKLASQLIESSIAQALSTFSKGPWDCELVSGWTNMGVPKLAYEIARELGMKTVGISAARAHKVRSGLFPVDESFTIGHKFGDESDFFIDYIDVLIRIGGGAQSRRECQLFKDKNQHKDQQSSLIIEQELEWLGP